MRERFWLLLAFVVSAVFAVLAARWRPDELAATNRWVGVAIALAGTIIVAQTATAQALRRLAEYSRGAWAWVKRLLARKPSKGSAVAFAGATVSTSAGSFATARVWPGPGRTDERIEALKQQIDEVEALLATTRNDLSQEAEKRREGLAALEVALREEIRTLRQLLEARERESTSIDARALPVTGWGIVLSGVPEELSRFHGWVWPTLGVFFCIRAVGQAFSDGPKKDAT